MRVEAQLKNGPVIRTQQPSAEPSAKMPINRHVAHEPQESSFVFNRLESLPLVRQVHVLGAMATILVVEDEPTIRDIVRLALEAEGHRVLTASSASDALAISATAEPRIDMLLTDANLRGMTGCELADSLVSKSSQTKVLFMSGGLPDNLLVERKWSFIQKPFELVELSRKVEQLFAMG